MTLQTFNKTFKKLCASLNPPNNPQYLLAIWMFYLFGLETNRKKPASEQLTI